MRGGAQPEKRVSCVNPVSDHADHEVLRTVSLSLSKGLPPEPTSPSARRGRRHPLEPLRHGFVGSRTTHQRGIG